MEIPEELLAALEGPAFELTNLPGVNGVGLGMREEEDETFLDELTVRVYVDDATDVPELPAQLADLPVQVIEFPVVPLFTPDTIRHDELLGGIQVEQAPLNAGTLGAIVLRNEDNTLAGLTCHHVCGNRGSRVFQPTAPPMPIGVAPDLSDSLGAVIDFDSPVAQTIPVPTGLGPFGGALWLGRAVDAGIFALDEAIQHNRTVSNGIADGFGPVDSTAMPAVKMFVRKRGAQTGPTGGLIVGIVLVAEWDGASPPPGHRYAMSRQFEIFFNPADCPDGILARGGDSGSVVFQSGTRNAVGLLWGGIKEGGRRAVMSDITVVERTLNVNLVWAFE
ncbi:hypothetical protein [Allorhizocola rhizosphaerae]|uniref:hypothetical protein n=1 Tax=Allorhizocola rhizosphaerae TaxID=1872709 RepID=UPI000E3B7C2A|nr:hypothetical protein [Allorhizocola rhizosphaerae]